MHTHNLVSLKSDHHVEIYFMYINFCMYKIEIIVHQLVISFVPKQHINLYIKTN